MGRAIGNVLAYLLFVFIVVGVLLVPVFQWLADGRWWVAPAVLVLGITVELFWLRRDPEWIRPEPSDGLATRLWKRLMSATMVGLFAAAALYVAWSVLLFLGSFLVMPTALPNDCTPGYYLNVYQECVSEPVISETVPDGATARCSDGTYSFSQNRRGACSQEGGVDTWDP